MSKRLSIIMDRTGTPAAFWLLPFSTLGSSQPHVSEALGGITPIKAATVKADISASTVPPGNLSLSSRMLLILPKCEQRVVGWR
jgi:hypothetical protein